MQLLKGDCLERLREIPDSSVDIVICDLPYGQTASDWDNKIDIGRLWEQLKRVGKTNTPFFFFCTTRFGVELINANPKWFRYDLVWEKNRSSGFLNARKMPMRSHEMIYLFYNKSPIYDIENNHTQICKDEYTHKTSVRTELYGDNYVAKTHGNIWEPVLPKSVLHFPLDLNKKYKHSTQKPVALLEWILKYYSKTGDCVLDPTMGSGSTGVACHRLGRQFIGIEMNDAIYDTAVARLREIGESIE